MTPRQFLLIMRARYGVALLTAALTVLATLAISLLMTKQYTATSAVVVDVKSPDPVSGILLGGMIAPGYMATQIDIINSERVAQRVVKLLRMEEDVVLRAQWQDDTDGRGQLLNWLATRLQKKLDAKPERESNVIKIGYTGSDPDTAAAVANAFAQAYLDVNLDLRLAPSRQYASFFDEQTKALRLRLERAQQALSSYQQKNGIVSADERIDFETAKLNETSSQLTAMQSQTTDSQSKRSTAQADTVAEVIQSPLINGLKADVARLNAKLQETNAYLGRNHPQTQRAEAELATLRQQLTGETIKIASSIDTTYQVGKLREQQLQDALALQKVRVLKLNKQRDELNVLRRDIETAQRAFEATSQRAAQTSIESQNGQTNIALLNAASVPLEPSRPRLTLNLLGALVLGSMLGIGLALLLELAHRRVRSADDLVEALNLPVLGSIASATRIMGHATPPETAAINVHGAAA